MSDLFSHMGDPLGVGGAGESRRPAKATWTVGSQRPRIEVNPPTMAVASLSAPSLFDADHLMNKPPYEETLMSMEEVRQSAGTNGLTAVSAFSGGGGSVTGFAMAGWRDAAAIEFVDSARGTLRSNYPAINLSPAEVLAEVQRWYKRNKEEVERVGLEYAVNKETVTKGKETEASFGWEQVQDALASDDASDLYQRMRHEVNAAVLSSHADEIADGCMVMWGDDVRGMDPYAFMDALGMKAGELDCFEGSPPCKAFSLSGVREGKWGVRSFYSGERHQKTDDLFLEYMRLALAFKAKTFIAENVSGLTVGKAGDDVLMPFIKEMEAAGYFVECKELDAADYGVPQRRPRVFIQGIRKGLLDKDGEQVMPHWPTALSYRHTVSDAVAEVESPQEEIVESWIGTRDELAEAHPEIDPEIVERVWDRQRKSWESGGSRFAVGDAWRAVGPGGKPDNTYFNLNRAHPDMPCPTITATAARSISAAGASHYSEPRKFTPTEAARIFTFPGEYHFEGDVEQRSERIARSVPPLLMRALASSIAEALKKVAVDKEIREEGE